MSEKSVLIVDDSATFRQLLCLSLTRLEGITSRNITQACDGQEAFEKVQSGNYSLVLTDINMPRMDGLEFVRKVREELCRADLPIIIITTRGATTEIERGMAVGASGYLPKPVSVPQLRDLVTGLLAEK